MKKWIKIYEKRFLKYVDKDGPIMSHMKTKCWIWTGSKFTTGYGQFYTPKLKRKVWKTHRFMWLMINKKIPNKLFILRKCDNRPCVHPSHLFLGTQKDNIEDAVKKGRMAHGNRHGSRTHPEKVARGIKHYNAKLKEKEVLEIRKLSNKLSQRKLAKKYKISRCSIQKIINGRGWKHVK